MYVKSCQHSVFIGRKDGKDISKTLFGVNANKIERKKEKTEVITFSCV